MLQVKVSLVVEPIPTKHGNRVNSIRRGRVSPASVCYRYASFIAVAPSHVAHVVISRHPSFVKHLVQCIYILFG